MKIYAASGMETLLELDTLENEKHQDILKLIGKPLKEPREVREIESAFTELVAPFLSSCELQMNSESVHFNAEEKIFKVQCEGFILEALGMPFRDGSVPLQYAPGYDCTYFPTILFEPGEKLKVLKSGGYAPKTPAAQVARDIAVVLFEKSDGEYKPFREEKDWINYGLKTRTTTPAGTGRIGFDVVPVTYLSTALRTLQDTIRGLRSDRLDILVQLRTERDTKDKEHRPYTRFIEKVYWDLLREKIS